MKKNYITLKSIAFINKVFILFILSAISSNLYAQNSDCSAKLEVVNNQTSKNAGESGTQYLLNLTNTGADKITYNFSVKNVGSNISTNKDALNNSEVNLMGKIYSNNSNKKFNSNKSNSEIEYLLTLDKDESIYFVVELKVPKGTKFGSKNKSKVNITAEKCKNFSLNAVLYTTIVDGE